MLGYKVKKFVTLNDGYDVDDEDAFRDLNQKNAYFMAIPFGITLFIKKFL